MKKLLLGSAAIIGLGAVAMSGSAMAGEGVTLGVGGHVKGYVNFVDQDETTGTDVRDIDLLSESELQLSGETTLDNGLTVGAYIELDLDDDTLVEENYAYFSGSWGRVNFGKEDGAAYLLQVGAPSADANIDGVRAQFQPVNVFALTGVGADTDSNVIDYDQDISGYDPKLTYLSPVFSGFQVGVSYTPEAGAALTPSGKNGNALDNEADSFGDIWDVAFRYEGEFDQVGVAFGAGYSKASLETDSTSTVGVATDDRAAWNVGLDLDWSAFGFGVSYSEDDSGELYIDATNNVDDEEILVIGADYTTGAFKLGASYMNNEVNNVGEVDRYSAGVVYTYGPGVTFRGSVHFLDVDLAGPGGEYDATNLLIGTQINF